jgi:hypothetical protein
LDELGKTMTHYEDMQARRRSAKTFRSVISKKTGFRRFFMVGSLGVALVADAVAEVAASHLLSRFALVVEVGAVASVSFPGSYSFGNVITA